MLGSYRIMWDNALQFDFAGYCGGVLRVPLHTPRGAGTLNGIANEMGHLCAAAWP